MTGEASTARTTATVCGHITSAPVAIRWIQTASGPGRTLYACPDCVHLYNPGPHWDDDVPGPRH
ncbi:hypothetical protein GCM10010387_00080 [Streptomyces inusitatus]|uniref:Uncharacterized protein n=1 Tax=Streptomyces inusitatus TaxID=68221 RepID=A0A918UI74_9ACTN|nr:hypothetical protein GCM10010387_00080 [Streptomyces inusitatus]